MANPVTDDGRDPPAPCPNCGSDDADITFTAEVHVVVETGAVVRVIVHDDSATGPTQVRCDGCGSTEPPAARAGISDVAAWVDAMLRLVDDESGWPDWQIGSW